MEREPERMTIGEPTIAAICEAAMADHEPRALSAEYNRGMDAIAVTLTNGRRLLIPREELQGLEDATPEEAAAIRNYGGLALCWTRLDVNHSVPSLLEHRYGSAAWMAKLARRGVAA